MNHIYWSDLYLLILRFPTRRYQVRYFAHIAADEVAIHLLNLAGGKIGVKVRKHSAMNKQLVGR